MKGKLFLIFAFCFLKVIIGIAQIVNVCNAIQLQNALLAAVPGQVITLADGIYSRNGGFYISAGINGTKELPIKLIGTAKAFITSNSQTTGYGLRLHGNNYWILEGFTIRHSKKAIVLDGSMYNVLRRITVNNIGDEGIHLRTFSSYNAIEYCIIDSLGMVTAKCGEGIYIGSSKDNWCTYTHCNPDTCNYNVVIGNIFGDHIVSENIDIKEGTTGGIIMNNVLNGTGLNYVNGGDSWIDVKGNKYILRCNMGHNSVFDGFQTHILLGWGDENVFSNNTMDVKGPGYGIKIITSNVNGTAFKNKVYSNNKVTNAVLGLTNVIMKVSAETCDTVASSVLTLQSKRH